VKKTYKMEISFWKIDDEIHIAFKDNLVGKIDGVTGITTVNECESSKRGHPHFYNQLKKILKENGMWNI
jgi:hypothetical protein